MAKVKIFLKRGIALILIFVLCLNNFAAAVSDNDGSAFITKSEFDSLKNDFQSQIDQYNISIDNKIDNAIASYLAGVTVTTEPEELWSRVVTLNGGPMWFINKLPGLGTETTTTNKKITLRRQLAALGVWDWKESWKYHTQAPQSHANNYGSVIVLYAVAGENSTTIINNSFYRIYQTRDEIDRRSNKGVWFIEDKDLNEIELGGETLPSGTNVRTWWSESTFRDIGLFNKKKTDISMLKSTEESGVGSAWIYHEDPDGKENITNYATTVYPVVNIHAYVHNFQNFRVPNSASESRGAGAQANFTTWYLTDNGKAYPTTTRQDYEADLPEGFGYKVTSNTGGGVPSDESETDNQYYLRVDLSKVTTTEDVDYSGKQFGLGSSQSVYCLRDIQKPEYSETDYDNIDVTDLEWTDVYFVTRGQEIQTNKMNDIRVKWKRVSLKPVSKKISAFSNNILSSVAGETVYNGGGIPLAKIIDDTTDTTVKLKLKTSTGTGNIHYMLSDEQFVEGAFNPSAKIKITGNTTSGTEIELKKNFEKKKKLWLNCYAETNGVETTVESFSIK